MNKKRKEKLPDEVRGFNFTGYPPSVTFLIAKWETDIKSHTHKEHQTSMTELDKLKAAKKMLDARIKELKVKSHKEEIEYDNDFNVDELSFDDDDGYNDSTWDYPGSPYLNEEDDVY